MANVVVVGAQWGDEGKAKVTDLLAEQADVVVRYQGGCNAGHTVKHGNEIFKFHLIPSGLLYTDKTCIIGPGTVIDPEVLSKEIDGIESRGYSVNSLRISTSAHITLPHHIAMDKAQESSLAENKIGTTGRGIGPTYMDKIGRLGLRVGDLYEDTDTLSARLTQILSARNPLLTNVYQLPAETLEQVLAYCQSAAQKLAPYVCDTTALIHERIGNGKSILFEGAQGTLLDIDHGTYPFVTSSNATAGGACTGSGLGPTMIDRVIGVTKAYTTRVGEGPFPTELNDEMGRRFVEVGQEFGTTTGRTRRCGWFDAVMVKYSVQVNGLDGLAITKLDVLDGLDEIKLCVAYRDQETGALVTQFPSQLSALKRLEPVYETHSGWEGSVKEIRDYDSLPKEAKSYLERISALTSAPISIVSVGPERSQTILLENPLEGPSRAFQRDNRLMLNKA